MPSSLSTILLGTDDRMLIEQYNEQARTIHKYAVLTACKYCGRTFQADSVEAHMKGCYKKKQYVNKEKDQSKINEDYEVLRKPRVLMCCVCGRQFGLTSLKIHYPQCQEKFINCQNKKGKLERKIVPCFTEEQLRLIEEKSDWSQGEIETFNIKVGEIYRQKGMVQCGNCKKRFLPDSYIKHKKNCVLINGKNDINDEQHSTKNNENSIDKIRRPKVLVCHICGREFGLTSLAIHQKQCSIKFVDNEKKKQRDLKKPLPIMPQMAEYDIREAQQWSEQLIENYNKVANEVYRKDSLYQCEICHRKFFEEALKKHLKYCSKNNQKQISKDQNVNNQSEYVETKDEMQKEDFEECNQFKEVSLIKNNETIKQVKDNQPPSSEYFSKSEEILITIPKQKQLIKQQQDKEIVHMKNSKVIANKIKNKFKVNPIKSIKQQPQQLQQTRKLPLQNQVKKQQESVIELSQQTSDEKAHKTQQKSLVNYSSCKQTEFQAEEVIREQCKKCGRKFHTDRLEKHMSVCKGKGEISNKKQIQPEKKYPIMAPNEVQQIQLEKCFKCSRKFAKNRLSKHFQVCKASNIPLKNQAAKQSSKIAQQVTSIIQPLTTKQCPKCGRQFWRTKFDKHANDCQGSLTSLQQNEKPQQKPKQFVSSYKEVPISNQKSDEFVQFDSSQLQKCGKCGRKFHKDRLRYHEGVCKERPKIKPKEELQLRKTREDFFNMVKNLKNQKIKQEQIDKQLDQSYNKLQKMPMTNHIIKKQPTNNTRTILKDLSSSIVMQPTLKPASRKQETNRSIPSRGKVASRHNFNLPQI